MGCPALLLYHHTRRLSLHGGLDAVLRGVVCKEPCANALERSLSGVIIVRHEVEQA
jgi:hypothetical protein